MSDDQPIDWLQSSNAERQLLYRTIERLVASGAVNWNDLLKTSLARVPSEHYLENFRRGLNSRKDCDRLYTHLVQHFPAHAREVVEAKPRLSQTVPWPQIDGATEGAELRGVSDRFAYDSRAERLRIAHLSIGERFCLELTSPVDGYAIVFRQTLDGWHLMPLPREPTVPVYRGRQWLGHYPDSRAIPSYDGSDHEEVFHLRALIGSRSLTEDLALQFGMAPPIPSRSLRSVPAKLKASESAWSIADTWVSVMPRFIPNFSAP